MADSNANVPQQLSFGFLYDLNSLFDQLNRKYWSGELPRFECEWSSRMISTWGCCYPTLRIIRISRFFEERPAPELIAVLVHEMIHIRVRGHGTKFRRELKRVGMEGDVEGCFPHLNELTHARRRAMRYAYECPRCGVRIRRRRKIRGFCSPCYDSGRISRFKLVETLA